MAETLRGKRACRAGVERKGMYREKGEDDVDFEDSDEVRHIPGGTQFLAICK